MKVQSSTPLMKQYHRIKKEHPNTLLFFQLGDFYEMFYEDAKIASRVLGLTLTSRFKGKKAVPMAGVPLHTVDTYIKKLLQAGYKVAICEQTETPEQARGLVKRDVLRVVTPGTLTEDSLLDARNPNYLLAFIKQKQKVGMAWIDISTAKFELEEIDQEQFFDEITRLNPNECIVPQNYFDSNDPLIQKLKKDYSIMITPLEDFVFEEHSAYELLLKHFKTTSLSGFGCENFPLAISSAGAIMEYLNQTQKIDLKHITSIRTFAKKDILYIDRTSLRALELVQNTTTNTIEMTLLWVLDKTLTPMGARLLKEWILLPITDVEKIKSRQDAIGELLDKHIQRDSLQKELKEIYDIERICSKLGTGRVNPKDLLALKKTLDYIPRIKSLLKEFYSKPLKYIHFHLNGMDEIKNLIDSSLRDDAPISVKDGGIIKKGYSSEIDELISLSKEGKHIIAKMQMEEVKKTGINNLKIGYNQVFGYYIEVTRTHTHKVPSYYIRKQTLKNAERYITPELKELETKILSAEERLKRLEYEMFINIREKITEQIKEIQFQAKLIAMLDVFCSLAQVAFENKYVRPEIVDDFMVKIEEGRHPVVEQLLKGNFVPNDVFMNQEGYRILLITGPNMAGKSTYIRQVALICIMAHIGSFVPAREAKVGLIDRIFTRIGASDEIGRGASTFLVEMNEVANILNNATERSLLILDEIGRGTSTFDGVSIAWAVTEYIHNKIGARTLFATHYHELTELEELLPHLKNYQIQVKEWSNRIIFMYKIIRGSTDRSYGIHVAGLAGLPKEAIFKAEEILKHLEALTLKEGGKCIINMKQKQTGKQLTLFVPEHSTLIEILREIDINNITPLEALQKLKEMKDLLKEKR